MNLSQAVNASMQVDKYSSKEDFLVYLESVSEYKTKVSPDKDIFIFSDRSLICCDGADVKARGAGSDISEFLN